MRQYFSFFFLFSFVLIDYKGRLVAVSNFGVLCRSPVLPYKLLYSIVASVQQLSSDACGFGSTAGCVLLAILLCHNSTGGGVGGGGGGGGGGLEFPVLVQLVVAPS